MRYSSVGYYKTYKVIEESVHRAIMIAHNPIPDYRTMFVNHIDGIRHHNVYSPGHPLHNLEWATHAENMRHAYRIGLNSSKGGYQVSSME
jgi:hypothetical protein